MSYIAKVRIGCTCFTFTLLSNDLRMNKIKHSIYYISKEVDDFNSLSKVSGREYVTGTLNGNIAMGLFNGPVSLTIYDNNSTERRMQDNL